MKPAAPLTAPVTALPVKPSGDGGKTSAPSEPDIAYEGGSAPKSAAAVHDGGPTPKPAVHDGGPTPKPTVHDGGPTPKTVVAVHDGGPAPKPAVHDGGPAPKPAGQDGGSAPKPPSTEPSVSPRRAFIEETAVALGRTWARNCRRDLHREGRAACGAWPGTMNEARTIVGHAFVARMQHRGLTAITEEERILAVRAAYASARIEWRRHAEPEGP